MTIKVKKKLIKLS